MTATHIKPTEWLLRGENVPEVVISPGTSLTVGRDLTSDLPLLDAGVSRHHAVISFEGERVWVEDLHSQNGTFVNSRRIRRERLQEGDIVTFGRVHLTLISRERAAVRPSGLLRPVARQDLTRILETVHELIEHGNRDCVFQRTLDAAARAVHADHGTVLLWDEVRETLHPVAAYPHEGFREMDTVVSRPFALAVLRSGRAQALGPSVSRFRGTSGGGVVPSGATSSARHPFAAAPLVTHGKPLGVLCLERSLGAEPFGDGDVHFLSAFAWMSGPLLSVAKKSARGLGERTRSEDRTEVLSAEALRAKRPPAPELFPLPVDVIALLDSRLERVCDLAAPSDEGREDMSALDPPEAPATTAASTTATSLRGAALGELKAIRRATRTLRMLSHHETFPVTRVDVGHLSRSILGYARELGLDTELEVKGAIVATAPEEPFVLALELLVEAAAEENRSGEAVTFSWTASGNRVRCGFRYREGRGSPREHLRSRDREESLPRRMAHCLAREYLLGRLSDERSAPGEIIALEFPGGTTALEETSKI